MKAKVMAGWSMPWGNFQHCPVTQTLKAQGHNLGLPPWEARRIAVKLGLVEAFPYHPLPNFWKIVGSDTLPKCPTCGQFYAS